MKRPSRGERWSATTTRQIGFLLLPTRVSLRRTATGSSRSTGKVDGKGSGRRASRGPRDDWPARATLADRSARLAHDRADVRHLAAADLAHDLAHLVELLDELVDLLDARAGTARDAQSPRALDQLGPCALLGGHRLDDRLDTVELALIDLEPLHLLAGEPGQHAQQVCQRAHLADLLELAEEVLERELVAAQLALELLGLLLVVGVLRLLDQAQDVAHAEDPLRHAVGVEALELVELL